MTFKSGQQKKHIDKLRQEVQALKNSKADVMKNLKQALEEKIELRQEFVTAKDLATFYEKQAAENEKLAELFKQVLTVLAECKVDISDILLVPDKIKRLMANDLFQTLNSITIIHPKDLEHYGFQRIYQTKDFEPEKWKKDALKRAKLYGFELISIISHWDGEQYGVMERHKIIS